MATQILLETPPIKNNSINVINFIINYLDNRIDATKFKQSGPKGVMIALYQILTPFTALTFIISVRV